jgi:hypothetical protein
MFMAATTSASRMAVKSDGRRGGLEGMALKKVPVGASPEAGKAWGA